MNPGDLPQKAMVLPSMILRWQNDLQQNDSKAMVLPKMILPATAQNDLQQNDSAVDALEGRYRASRSVRDLLAWSDAVGAESARICRAVRGYCSAQKNGSAENDSAMAERFAAKRL